MMHGNSRYRFPFAPLKFPLPCSAPICYAVAIRAGNRAAAIGSPMAHHPSICITQVNSLVRNLDNFELDDWLRGLPYRHPSLLIFSSGRPEPLTGIVESFFFCPGEAARPTTEQRDRSRNSQMQTNIQTTGQPSVVLFIHPGREYRVNGTAGANPVEVPWVGTGGCGRNRDGDCPGHNPSHFVRHPKKQTGCMTMLIHDPIMIP